MNSIRWICVCNVLNLLISESVSSAVMSASKPCAKVLSQVHEAVKVI